MIGRRHAMNLSQPLWGVLVDGVECKTFRVDEGLSV